jgi:hypothetical protein
MISFDLLRDKGILVVKPQGALEAGDFARLAQEIDPYIADQGALSGLLIEAPSFPGWENFAALLEHFRFVRDHHKKIRRVAAVTDSSFLKVAPTIAAHFAHPEIKVFGGAEKARALAWLEGGKQ